MKTRYSPSGPQAMIGVLFFSVCALLFALPLPSVTFAPSDPNIVVYGVSLTEELNDNGTIVNSSLAMTVEERTEPDNPPTEQS